MKNQFKAAHEMAREIKAQYTDVNYSFQFSLCLKYLTSKKEEIKMVELPDRVLTALNNLDDVKFNKIYASQVMTDATKMFNDGWDALEDGIVVNLVDNQVIIKRGNSLVNQEMTDFRVNSGKVFGTVKRIIKEKELDDSQKLTWLAQAIITRYYTLKTI